MPDDTNQEAKQEPKVETLDLEKVKSEASASLLASLGFKSEKDAKDALAALKALQDEKLTEQERREKQIKESLKHADEIAAERDKLKREKEEAAAEAKALKESIKRREHLDAQGVALSPQARAMASALYDVSKAAKDFDEAKFWENARKEHPSLFGSTASSAGESKPANTAPKDDTKNPLAGGPGSGAFINDFEGIPGLSQYYPGRALEARPGTTERRKEEQ